MPVMPISLPESIVVRLRQRAAVEGVSVDHLVSKAVAEYLGESVHTLFQVSTSAALVEGLYQGALRISVLKQHGDFGLGTFIDLDGEMVVLEGSAYRIASTGQVTIAADELLIPYAVVTRFRDETSMDNIRFASLTELEVACDALRGSQNLFYAIRLDGEFSSIRVRVMGAVSHGARLGEAASAQAEFRFERVRGSLIGLWSPQYAASFSVPGYHFHFLSDDRSIGGHVLDCASENCRARACSLDQLHVALPETEQFLRADLTRDPNEALRAAEHSK